jgi:hypothetical protein
MIEDIEKLVVTQSLKSVDNLEVAFETYNNWGKVLNFLATEFYNQLYQPLTTQLNEIPGNWKVEQRSTFNIYLTNALWQGLELGIGDYDADRVHFFVKCSDEYKIELYAFIKDRLSGTSNLNIWYQRLINPYNKWDKSFEGIISVYNPQELTVYATSKLYELATVIEQYFKNKTI